LPNPGPVRVCPQATSADYASARASRVTFRKGHVDIVNVVCAQLCAHCANNLECLRFVVRVSRDE